MRCPRVLCALLGAWFVFAAPARAQDALEPDAKGSGGVTRSADAPRPSPLPGLGYTEPMFRHEPRDANIRTVEEILGFPEGQRAATHAEIETCLKEWAEKSPRATLVEYARTYEGRACYYVVITSETNMRRLDEIKAGIAKLSNPGADDDEIDDLLGWMPAVAWMAYSIHGDETSGADAALALIWHLLSGTFFGDDDKDLDDLVVIVDPNMNPDGRDRFLRMVAQHRGLTPNVDDQSLLHTGYWPWGRRNHYGFDMNRDWIFASQPETRGRILAVREWNPQLFVDAHEMFSQDTFLFSPPRAPHNPHHPTMLRPWAGTMALSIAASFDTKGWRYYTGEWNEGWYPGYSDSWAAFRGAIGMLYEQARIAHDGVRRQEGTIEPYRLTVHKQAAASMACLETLRANRTDIMNDYVKERRRGTADDEPHSKRVFIVKPSANEGRTRRFLDLMSMQGIECYITTMPTTINDVTDRLSVTHPSVQFPAGTIVIKNQQPEANLVSTLLEFDTRLPDEFLERERRELIRFNQSKLYDTTAWCIPMLFDVEAFYAMSDVPTGMEKHVPKPDAPANDDPREQVGDSTVGWVVHGADDRTVSLAALLMEREARVRVADKEFSWDGKTFPRGSVVITRVDNSALGAALPALIIDVCREVGLRATPVLSGKGKGEENPDIGGEHFVLMERPRIAILARGSVSPNEAGEAWFAIDQRLGVRASLLEIEGVSYADLRRYNVIVASSLWGEESLTRARDALKQWVEAGGTLIATGNAAATLARGEDDGGIGSVRLLPDVLEELDEYVLKTEREWVGRTTTVEHDAVWEMNAPTSVAFPWADAEELPDADELKRRDAWQSVFMPQGAIVATRTDDRHWLTFGCREMLPAMFMGETLLMAGESAAAPIRVGYHVPAPPPKATPETPPPPGTTPAPTDGETSDAQKEEPKRPRVGWAPNPPGHDLRVRMSGLLWPEAAQRIANSAYVTCERVGDGQVILFAAPPAFRASTLGMMRVFHNAVVYGPGFGANSEPIIP